MSIISRRRVLISGAAFALTPLLIGGHAQARSIFQGPTMGTGYRVIVPGLAAHRFDEIHAGIRRALTDVTVRMSPFLPQSEVSRFNRLVPDQGFRVSPETTQVVAAALDVAQMTKGAFDPVAGARAADWGFGPTPSPVGDYRSIRCDLDAGILRKTTEGAVLDLCGIAKGFALDHVAATLRTRGVSRFLIEIGGEVRADGSGWRVAVARPGADTSQAQTIVRLGNQSIATSGDSQQYFDDGDRRYAAVIDPKTGRPANFGVASVSVVANTAMQADALATGLMAMAPEAALLFANVNAIAALVLVRENGKLVELGSSAFSAFKKERPS